MGETYVTLHLLYACASRKVIGVLAFPLLMRDLSQRAVWSYRCSIPTDEGMPPVAKGTGTHPPTHPRLAIKGRERGGE